MPPVPVRPIAKLGLSAALAKRQEELEAVRRRKQELEDERLQREQEMEEREKARQANEAVAAERKALELELERLKQRNQQKKLLAAEMKRKKDDELAKALKAEKERIAMVEKELRQLEDDVPDVKPEELEKAGALPEQQFPDAHIAHFDPCVLRRWRCETREILRARTHTHTTMSLRFYSFSWAENRWSKEPARVAIAAKSFSRGAMREAFKCLVRTSNGQTLRYVCKSALKAEDNDLLRVELVRR